MIETPGNFIFKTKFKLETVYLTFGSRDNLRDNNDIFSMVINGMLLTNIFIFTAKIVVELSIGMNRLTNIIEAGNLVL